MTIAAMNHFTVLSEDLEATRAFYVDLLGMQVGARPDMGFDGLWLYAGGQPILHVMGRDTLPDARAGVIDHMAFSATNLRDTVARLNARGLKYRLNPPRPDRGWQLFCRDPSGALVELDFDGAEAAPDAA